jgi:hypothetical protein
MTSTGTQRSADAATEAARYALLRRLAPSMRHHLVVNLQPIGMIYEVMDRRLRAAAPDLGELRDSAQKIHGFARAALDSSLDVVTWLAPPPGATIAAADGIKECLGLVATSLTFRGFALRNQAAEVQAQAPRGALRTVFTAALMHLTDENQPPAEVVIGAKEDPGALILTLTVTPGPGESGFTPELPYRAITWGDLQALAAAESVEVERLAKESLTLTIPWPVGA